MTSEPVLLPRLQFAVTVGFHILWPAYTIGVSGFIAIVNFLQLLSGVASATPRSPPSSDTRRLSMATSRANCQRELPRAVRTASSRCLSIERAISR